MALIHLQLVDLSACAYDKECDVFVFIYFIYRDRMVVFWQSIQDHLYSLLVNATEHTFVVERAVVGLLRLTIRLLRRDEIAAQVSVNVVNIIV